MFKIRCIAATGFDRAIVAMRREHGGSETGDSRWKDTGCGFGAVEYEYVIGPEDKAECARLIQSGDRDFLKFVGVWAHIEAPAQWWAVYGGYFIAQSDVNRKGDTLTRSVFTTYANLRNLIEVISENSNAWKMQTELVKVLKELPEYWMILEGLEA